MPELDEYKNTKKLKTVVVVAGIAISTVFLCVFFLWFLHKVISEETEKYLAELSEKTVRIVKSEFDDNFSDMELMAKAVGLFSDAPDAEKKLQEFAANAENIYGYSRLGIVAENGDGVISGGHTMNFAGEEFLRTAFSGEPSVSDPRISAIDGNEILIYAVLVAGREGKEDVAFLWSRSVESLHDRLKITSFYNEGHSHLMKRDGTFIIENEEDAVRHGNISRFLREECSEIREEQIAGLMENLQKDQSGFISYKKGEIAYIGAYAPLGINDWFLLDVVPEITVNGSFNRGMNLGVGVVAGILILCLTMLVYINRLQKKNYRGLQKMAFEDPVTGGGNITYFREKAVSLIHKAPPGTYAMVSIDINSFKLINVTFGQEAGDRTLKYVYKIFREALEPGELVARMTQDQFRMLLKNAPLERLVKRLEDAVERVGEYNKDLEQKYFLSFSAGIRVVDEPNDNIIIIGDQVNMARKRAKGIPRSGALSWAVYETRDKANMMREKEILDDVERGLKDHEFAVYLQPKIDIKTGHLAGAEALVRWITPDGPMIRPDEFIPVLEEHGKIVKLDLYMFREVCRILKSWEERGFREVPISVNFSRINMTEKGILDKYREIQTASGVPAGLLEIELTETMIRGNTEYFKMLFEQIHRMGFTCSLDDFGSGYSSLNILVDLPVDVIKLDRQFFRLGTENEERENRIVSGMVQVAKSLGIRTVAEGVEDVKQVEFLRKTGCDMIQGFYYSKPVPVEEFEKKYRKELDRTQMRQ